MPCGHKNFGIYFLQSISGFSTSKSTVFGLREKKTSQFIATSIDFVSFSYHFLLSFEVAIAVVDIVVSTSRIFIKLSDTLGAIDRLLT